MKYRIVLSLAALLAVGGFVLVGSNSVEAQVSKAAIDKALAGDIKAIKSISRAAPAGQITVTPVGTQRATLVIGGPNDTPHRRQFPWFDGHQRVRITAPADKDIYIPSIYSNPVFNSKGVWVNSLKSGIASSTAPIVQATHLGQPIQMDLYKITKGTGADFWIDTRVDTSELLKGGYYIGVRYINYLISRDVSGNWFLVESINGIAPTNSLQILGEKAPYITAFAGKPLAPAQIPTATVNKGEWVVINGVELYSSDTFVDGKKVPLANLMIDVQKTKYRVQDTLTSGVHTLHMLDPLFGKSQTVWFTVGTSTVPLKVDIVAPTTATSTTAQVNQPIQFTAQAIGGGSGSYGYTWDFGDGSIANGKTVSKSFSSPGWQRVSVEVRDITGNTASDVIGVNVQSQEAVGIEVDLRQALGTYDNNLQAAIFRIEYDITALEGDVYIDRNCISASSAVAGYTSYKVVTNPAITTGASVCTMVSSAGSQGNSYKVGEAETESFELDIVVPVTVAGQVKTQINGIAWAETEINGNKVWSEPGLLETLWLAVSGGGAPVISGVQVSGVAAGSSWPIGSSQTVTWSGSGFANVDIIICSRVTSRCYGGAMGTANDGSQAITIPSSIPAGTGYIIVRKQGDGSVKALSYNFTFTAAEARASRNQLASTWEAFQNFLVRIAVGR